MTDAVNGTENLSQKQVVNGQIASETTTAQAAVELPLGRLSTADKWLIGRFNKIAEPWGAAIDIADLEQALPRGFTGILNNATKIMIALLVVGAAYFGYKWWQKRKADEEEAAWVASESTRSARDRDE